MSAKLFWLIAMSLWWTSLLAGNYKLTIDGDEHEIDLGETAIITIDGGQKIKVKLEKKDIVVYKSSMFSFSHPSTATPSKTDLGDGIHQTMMATPTGTLVLVQEYADMDPSGLIDLMIRELTKEEAEYGYQITKSDATMKLSDGRTVVGKRASSKYRTTEIERYVVCYSGKDTGILIVTQVQEGASPADLAMIDLFWKTLSLSAK